MGSRSKDDKGQDLVDAEAERVTRANVRHTAAATVEEMLEVLGEGSLVFVFAGSAEDIASIRSISVATSLPPTFAEWTRYPFALALRIRASISSGVPVEIDEFTSYRHIMKQISRSCDSW